MGKVLYFEELEVGDSIPPLVKRPTPTSMFMYAAAVWLTHRIHYDHTYATGEEHLPNILLPGTIAGDWYAQLLMDWIGEAGELKKIKYQNRHFMLPGDVITCGGVVKGLAVRDGRGYAECTLWMKNQNSIDCTPGSGTICLPLRER